MKCAYIATRTIDLRAYGVTSTHIYIIYEYTKYTV